MQEATIRMYRQGLGDCFLLTFPRRNGKDFHMMIDHGVFRGTEDSNGQMQKVAQNIAEVTGKHLDVVVVTHEHWDHLSGFIQAREIWDDQEMKIDKVWVAWTEDLSNQLASDLRKGQALQLTALNRLVGRADIAGTASQLTMGLGETKFGIEGLLEYFGEPMTGDPGRPTTRAALEYIKSKVGPNDLKYCHPNEDPIMLDGVEGVRIYVLGPPMDRELLLRYNPSKANSQVYTELTPSLAQSFLVATGALDDEEDSEALESVCFPFDPSYHVSVADAKGKDGDDGLLSRFFNEHYGFDRQDDDSGWRTIEDDWLGSAGGLALDLDSATNNTSLVLAFEFVESKKVLLFAADAQVGNWLSWKNCKWTVKDDNGESREVDGHDLLARTVFYKVGHHGSHNATMKAEGLEIMATAGDKSLVAMIPVDQTVVNKKHWKMPFDPLRKQLVQKTGGRVILAYEGRPTSDRTDQAWQQFVDATPETDLYIDYKLQG